MSTLGYWKNEFVQYVRSLSQKLDVFLSVDKSNTLSNDSQSKTSEERFSTPKLSGEIDVIYELVPDAPTESKAPKPQIVTTGAKCDPRSQSAYGVVAYEPQNHVDIESMHADMKERSNEMQEQEDPEIKGESAVDSSPEEVMSFNELERLPNFDITSLPDAITPASLDLTPMPEQLEIKTQDGSDKSLTDVNLTAAHEILKDVGIDLDSIASESTESSSVEVTQNTYKNGLKITTIDINL